MDTFSSNTSLKLKKGKWIISVTSFYVNNSDFNVAKQKNRFPFYTPGHWEDPETIEKLDELMGQRKLKGIK